MKKTIVGFSLACLLGAFASEKNEPLRFVPNESFNAGEIIKFRAHYGFLTGGEGTMEVSDNIYTVNGRPCYKIDLKGETTGIVDYMFSVKDNWRSYMDTTAMLPQKFYMFIKEGNFRKNQGIIFDHSENKAVVEVMDKFTRELKRREEYDIPEFAQDLISGYYFLRTLDYSTVQVGDVIRVAGFFDKDIYDFRIMFKGRETIDTELGEFPALRFVPIMHENDLFEGDESIEFWLSDDKRRLPLRIKAEMYVGAVALDIKEYYSKETGLWTSD
ncbi:MAG TPA: DUF3108 domain-containing protein [Cytophagales bacterium]|nr:DUF3108 domain-containing protein [Cytophagales bacterium]HAA23348.1 DUF3108 domain-containing protein [Cytophagales bacterium]HAP65018.1 DUF3108 domain-containing protein [Cytophagales bacterium]